MIAEAPGAGADFVDAIVPDAIAKAPGFVSHVSGLTSTGTRVVEVWQTREAHQAWYDEHIAPNLPPGMGPIPAEYVDLRFEVPKR